MNRAIALVQGFLLLLSACYSNTDALEADVSSDRDGSSDGGTVDSGSAGNGGDGSVDSGDSDSGPLVLDDGGPEDAGSMVLDADVDAGPPSKVTLPREPLPFRPTLLRLVNDTAEPVQLLAGCNNEDWLSVDVPHDALPDDPCACEDKFVDGTCDVPEPWLTCQAYWYEELPAGETHERTVQPRHATWFDSIGCYIFEGLPEDEPLEYHLALEAAGEITRTVPYGAELVEINVSEAGP